MSSANLHQHPGYKYQFSPKCTDEDSWNKCMDAVRQHDHDMCKGWVKNLDALLVFAGLFTAVVTAFTVDSYHWLLPDNNDITVQLLHQISHQLSNSSYVVAPLPAEENFVPSNAAIRINAFWFSSIALSLSSSLITILCKQWILEYARDPALSSKEALEFRQLRFRGLEKWKLPTVLASPSFLLQGALVLFFAGVLDMLWQFEESYYIAVVVTIVIGVVMTAIVFTTVASTVYLALGISSVDQSDQGADLPSEKLLPSYLGFFPYKSPHAAILYEALALFFKTLRRLSLKAKSGELLPTSNSPPSHWRLPFRVSWKDIERGIQKRVAKEGSLLQGLAWLYAEVEHDTTMTNHILHCISSEYAHAYQEKNRRAFLDLFADVCNTPLLYNHKEANDSRKFRIELITQTLEDLSPPDRTKQVDPTWAKDVVSKLLPVLHDNMFPNPPDLRPVGDYGQIDFLHRRCVVALMKSLRGGLVPVDEFKLEIFLNVVWPKGVAPEELANIHEVVECYNAILGRFRGNPSSNTVAEAFRIAATCLLQRLVHSGLASLDDLPLPLTDVVYSLDSLMGSNSSSIDANNIFTTSDSEGGSKVRWKDYIGLLIPNTLVQEHVSLGATEGEPEHL